MDLVRVAIIHLTLALSFLLAGCGAPTEPAPAAPDDVGLVTDPDDYSYLQNGTDGSGWHVHDYWRGQRELVVLDAETEVRARCEGCDGGMMLASLRPEPERIVPQGAAWVNVTVTLHAEEADLEGYELWVKTAADAEERLVGPVVSGQTLTLNTTNEQDDPPHHVLSLWRFAVRAVAADGTLGFAGSIGLHATAARGHEIPPYPPHPDLWGGADELLLLSDGQDLVVQQEEDNSYSCYAGCLGRHAPEDGVVVPYDAAEVVVRLTHAPAGVPTLGLRFHGADTWEMRVVEPETRTPLETVWRIPLAETRGDSPYAKQSLWELRVFNDQPTSTRAWAGNYHLEATALRAAG